MGTNGKATYEVRSFTSNVLFIVRYHDDDHWSCSCPDHTYRHRTCKHIALIMAQEGIDDEHRMDHKPALAVHVHRAGVPV